MAKLGNMVEALLSRFGITSVRVSRVLNVTDCGCTRRKEALNSFGESLKRRTISPAIVRRAVLFKFYIQRAFVSLMTGR